MVANLEPDLAEACLEGVDAVLLSGGVDIDPPLFGQEPEPGLGRVDRRRDLFELELYRRARERGLPVLGICRGIQVINVAHGGTLHQHLPAQPGMLQHDQVDIGGEPSHTVELVPGSALAERLGERQLRANSYHHQGVAALGEGLRPVGRTADDLVEAVEGAGNSFLLGVQWHPEMSFRCHPEHLLPFQLLVEAARREVHSVGA